MGSRAGQVGQVERLLAFGGGRVGREAGDVGGQVPALTVVELISEGRHIGAFDAQAQSVIDLVEAQTIQARGIPQVGRRRGRK